MFALIKFFLGINCPECQKAENSKKSLDASHDLEYAGDVGDGCNGCNCHAVVNPTPYDGFEMFPVG